MRPARIAGRDRSVDDRGIAQAGIEFSGGRDRRYQLLWTSASNHVRVARGRSRKSELEMSSIVHSLATDMGVGIDASGHEYPPLDVNDALRLESIGRGGDDLLAEDPEVADIAVNVVPRVVDPTTSELDQRHSAPFGAEGEFLGLGKNLCEFTHSGGKAKEASAPLDGLFLHVLEMTGRPGNIGQDPKKINPYERKGIFMRLS